MSTSSDSVPICLCRVGSIEMRDDICHNVGRNAFFETVVRSVCRGKMRQGREGEMMTLPKADTRLLVPPACDSSYWCPQA